MNQRGSCERGLGAEPLMSLAGAPIGGGDASSDDSAQFQQTLLPMDNVLPSPLRLVCDSDAEKHSTGRQPDARAATVTQPRHRLEWRRVVSVDRVVLAGRSTFARMPYT
eukprot:CAMPEP_0181207374 /NCGR_PEP_ID=MMETSP1096-20121128/21552_1 /TAXON_ID=156174 ORGANISM="Chrysochromulina ericina, Strain CCMP281" /NCGR_SAMPLE_ID=MMETSP1096 /ASSEMBLY_ACC=CAM_ASM_000453 /LENGTH=108 /DNA_ID=CAMNT_0023298371 /DNA_START=707 /DNA_END=1034 /DNA_ORIENTATION=-